jgi:two-component system cell cycle response regulator
MKVLIVEPSRLVALMLASMFGKHGFEVIQARNGAEALNLLARQRVDLLCFAYELGDMNGIDLFVTVKARGFAYHQPALLFASTHDKKVVDHALEAGVTECFSKKQMARLDEFVGRFAQGGRAHLEGSVLLVEDSATAALFCRQMLERIGLKVEQCRSAEQAIEHFAKHNFDLVITDYVLAGTETGLSVINAVRASPGKKGLTPILAMSALVDTARKVEILRNGANDFVHKPVVAEELEMRVVNLMTMRALVRRLESQHEAMQEMAMHDQLTGLFNRYYLQEKLPALLRDSQRKGQAVSLLMCDIDHFKRINDTHGHKTGDQVLEAVATELQHVVRNRAIVARVGGEEFVVVLSGADQAQAAEQAEALRVAVAALIPAGLPVTLSFGVAERQLDEDYEDLFKRADAAVYRAKEAGRNRVEVAAG